MMNIQNSKNMKKKVLYITTSLILAFVQYSCTDEFLELEPKTGQVEANYYKTESDAFLSVVGVYDALTVQNWQFVPIMSDIFSDDAFAGGSDANDMRQWQETELLSKMTLENQAAFDLWNRCYSGIYRANLYLEKQELIEWKTDGLKERLEAEVKFIRAYLYWDLVRHYASVPIILEVFTSVEDYKNIGQSSPAEVYAQVASDLNAAIPVLPTNLPASEVGRVSKYAAQALMARVYMYYEGYGKGVLGLTGNLFNKADVIAALDGIIASNEYQLLTNYADVFDWNNQNNAESILEWQYSEKAKSGDWGGWGIDGNFSVIFYGPRNPVGDESVQTGWAFGLPTWSLANEYEAGDPRKDASLYNADDKLTTYTKAFQNSGFFNRKYMPITDFLPTAGEPAHNWAKNYIDIRYAEVLLMAAELNLGTDDTKALNYLNQVRTRSLGAGAALTAITLDDIYHENRVEFGGEGHRKWDLLRRGLAYTEQKITESFNPPVGVSNPGDFTNRGFVPETLGLFPIPASEIRNTNEGVLTQFVSAY